MPNKTSQGIQPVTCTGSSYAKCQATCTKCMKRFLCNDETHARRDRQLVVRGGGGGGGAKVDSFRTLHFLCLLVAS